MSKVKGNVINPLEAIDDYGADALRFAITTGTAPGNDVQVSSQKLEAARNFANKIWNAARFVIRSLPPGAVDMQLPPDMPVEDRWILSRLDRLVVKTDRLLGDFQFGEAEMQLHEFLWGEFCDWYVELAKIRLREESSPSPIPVLVHTLETSLRLAHPFMPFITEEIWQTLMAHLQWDTSRPDSVMIAPYPAARGYIDDHAEAEMGSVIEIIRSIRNARAESRVESARWVEARIFVGDPAALEAHRQAIETLARVRPLTLSDRRRGDKAPEGAMVLVLKEAEVVLPAMADLEAERQRLLGERKVLEARVADLRTRLSADAFLSKAPPSVVDKERGRLVDSEDRLKKIAERLDQLS